MREKITTILCLTALAGSVASCGSGNSLSTGSILGGGSQTAAAATAAPVPKPVTPTERAVYVGATVGRAQRCGFYFEPEQVKSNYLSAEAQAGTPAEQVQKATRDFDSTRSSILSSAAQDEGYCTEGRTREVKAALARQLAGDFNPPQKKQELSIGVLEHQSKGAAFDPNAVFDKSARPQRRPGEID